MSALREIVAAFGFEVDEKGAKHAEGVIGSLVGKIEKIGGIIAGAFLAKEVKEFIVGQIEAGSAVHDTAEKLGVSGEELQKFDYAAKLAGVSAESAGHALGFLNKNAGLAITGNEEAAKSFASLGIQVKDSNGHVKPAGDLALDLADKLKGMGSQAERTAAITKVMGRAGAELLPLFSEGAEGVKKAYDEFEELGGGMSEEFLAAADAAGDQIDRLKFAFNGLKVRIAGAVIPTLTKVTTFFTKMVAQVGKLADKTNLFSAGITALGGIGGVLTVLKLAKAFGIADTGAFGFIKTLFKMGPIILLIGALFLAFEDLYTLFTGGDSLIGQLLGKEESEKLIKDLKGAWDELSAAVVGMLPALKELGVLLLQAFIKALPAIIAVTDAIVKGFTAAIQLLTGLGGAIAAAFRGDWAGVGKAIDKAGDAVFGKGGTLGSLGLGQTSSDLRDTAAWGGHGGYQGGATVATLPQSQLSGLSLPPSIGQQTNQTYVTVQGATTNSETGKAVAAAVVDANREKQNALASVQKFAPAP